MRILVIGGTGFIGRPLVGQLIEQGHSVAVLHRHRSSADVAVQAQQIIGDRRDVIELREGIREFAPDVVIDLILSSGKQAEDLVAGVKGIAGRIVAISSMDVYRACGVLHGSEPGPLEPLPLTEDSPLRTKMQTYPPEVVEKLQEVFGWLDNEYDKIPVERAIMSSSEVSGTVLRLPMIYGPGDLLRRFFPVVRRIEDGRAAILFADDLAEWRSPRGYVDNVAAAIALAATSPHAAGQIYNVVERVAFSELEWAQKIADQLGWQGRFVVLPHEQTPQHLLWPGNLAQHWIASSDRIRQDLGYKEIVDVDEAIRRTIEWERATPPPQASFATLDYEAEDSALRQTQRH
jgi:nucleoside-diphosphate-sugar epimerase